MTNLLHQRCAACDHAEALHVEGSVCGAMHCYCKAFVTPRPRPAVSPGAQAERDPQATPSAGDLPAGVASTSAMSSRSAQPIEAPQGGERV